MRLNASDAKLYRKLSGYRNQSATPSRPEFPGIARIYSAPVYATRPALVSSYEMRDGKMVRVLRKVTSMVVMARYHQRPEPALVMGEHTYPADHPRAGQKYNGPQLEMLPVVKKVAVTGPKAQYRQLKRLHKKGVMSAFARLSPAQLGKDFVQFVKDEAARVGETGALRDAQFDPAPVEAA